MRRSIQLSYEATDVCGFIAQLARWRAEGGGHRVVTFSDYGIGGSPDYASCLVLSRSCRSDLDSAGFFVNLQKSLWEPSQVGTWLGFHLDFSFNFITVPPSKISKLQGSISRILALVNIVFFIQECPI